MSEEVKTLEDVGKIAHDLKEVIEKQKEGTATQEQVDKAVKDYIEKTGEYQAVQKERKSEPEVEVTPGMTLEEIHKAQDYRIDSPMEEIQKRAHFQQVADKIYWLDILMKDARWHDGRQMYDIRKAAKDVPSVKRLFAELADCKKALYSTGSTAGDEWVPTAISGQLYTDVRVKTRLLDIFPVVQMPTNPYNLPLVSGDVTVYLQNEATQDSAARLLASQVTTGDEALSAVKLAVRALWSGEMDEDSIIPVLSMYQNNIRVKISEALESMICNGDTASTHTDNGTVTYYASTAPEMGCLGLRAWCVDQSNSTAATGTMVIADWLGIKKSMGKYALNPDEVFWLTSPMGYNLLMGLTDIHTVDKYGANASILTGEVGRLYGAPVIVSGQFPENLNATGVYDGSTVDNTGACLVRRDAGVVGFRRQLKVETQRIISTDQTEIVATVRPAFVVTYGTTPDPMWYLYNVD